MTKEEMMKRYPNVDEAVIDDINRQIKPFFDDLLESIKRVRGEIAEINEEAEDKNE